MVWAPGKQLQKGRYTIEDVLRVGQLGVTYLAKTPQGEAIVIKTPNDEAMHQLDCDRLQQVFVQEAFKLAQCRHPHIVKAEQPFLEDSIWCIPMEYIAGTTLDKRDRPILPEAEALEYVRQIGSALEVVHQNGLLHRDVTPRNILMRIRNGKSEAVLIDFGLARDFELDLTQTRTEEISPGFTPLELYSRSGDRGAYTDVYSLGATLYVLLTGETPPSAADRQNPGKRLVFPKSMSGQTRQAIDWAMKLKGGDRPQSVSEWLKALPQPEAAVSQQATTLTSSPEPKRKLETWQLIFAGIAAIGALLAGLQGIAALMEATKPDSTPTPTQTQTP
ncbi:MAG: serine/threonine protein kinase [Drouetiella hepatica Uher 2000/2452]|uniref:Serine/threonine protein kinase n=1 Tax=Drouetiella hepatica Uher 2000/2452 TaxID=904376 RepID=A0A951QDB3_9CYAN|nr:serine/threonine protein kinase [Drouetiella hepatica Uher 2000/2452]